MESHLKNLMCISVVFHFECATELFMLIGAGIAGELFQNNWRYMVRVFVE